jgi:uncharacterized membrane protein
MSPSDAEAFCPPRNRMVIAILALLGLLVSLYMLAYALEITGTVVCGLGDCEKVQSSPYSHLGSFPLAGFGVIGYLALMVISLRGLHPPSRGSSLIPLSLLGGGVLGVFFSAYLTYLEAFVIHAWCQWCVSSAILTVLAFLASLPELRRFGGSS